MCGIVMIALVRFIGTELELMEHTQRATLVLSGLVEKLGSPRDSATTLLQQYSAAWPRKETSRNPLTPDAHTHMYHGLCAFWTCCC